MRRLREPSARPVAMARASRKYHDEVVAMPLVASSSRAGEGLWARMLKRS